MSKVETFAEIAMRWNAEGKMFRPREVRAEIDRQQAWQVREREERILVNSPNSEVAGQIRDHRENGNWTTQRREQAI